MYLYCGKRITREEKRRQQRLRANLIGVALAAAWWRRALSWA